MMLKNFTYFRSNAEKYTTNESDAYSFSSIEDSQYWPELRWKLAIGRLCIACPVVNLLSRSLS